MPLYSYKCDNEKCNDQYDQIRLMQNRNLTHICFRCHTGKIARYFPGEGFTAIDDWEAGHNESINYNYKNKADLMSEIRRRGLRPLKHGGGVTKAKPGLYGDEENMKIMVPSNQQPGVG